MAGYVDFRDFLTTLDKAGQLLRITDEVKLEPDLAACQSARKFDPVSAFNFDPFARRGLRVALDSSELAGIAETRRARVA